LQAAWSSRLAPRGPHRRALVPAPRSIAVPGLAASRPCAESPNCPIGTNTTTRTLHRVRSRRRERVRRDARLVLVVGGRAGCRGEETAAAPTTTIPTRSRVRNAATARARRSEGGSESACTPNLEAALVPQAIATVVATLDDSSTTVNGPLVPRSPRPSGTFGRPVRREQSEWRACRSTRTATG
jgi:hypothetical protein